VPVPVAINLVFIFSFPGPVPRSFLLWSYIFLTMAGLSFLPFELSFFLLSAFFSRRLPSLILLGESESRYPFDLLTPDSFDVRFFALAHRMGTVLGLHFPHPAPSLFIEETFTPGALLFWESACMDKQSGLSFPIILFIVVVC